MTDEPKRYQLLLAELKRRRVFKVAALYGAAAFAVMQSAEFLLPALHFPESVATVIAVIAIAGFPFAMALAWLYDLTRQGVVRTLRASEDELQAIVAEPRRRRWPAGILGLVGVLLLAGGVWWSAGVNSVDNMSTTPTILAANADGTSIAVLPFVDISGGEQSGYFGEGIAKELLSALTRVPGVKVAAPTSAFAFRGTEVDVRTIGERLDVATVLEGSIDRSADGLRIAVQLVRAADGARLWSATYARKREDVFAVQNEIAEAIVGALGITIHNGAAANLVRTSTTDIAAYDDYLRGQYLAGQHTLAALDSAAEFYNRALLLDPDYAAAYAALAEVYMMEPDYGGPPIVELLPYARAAAQRAIALGPDLPQAHAVSAQLEWFYEWDRESAERDYRKAIELDPNYANAHNWYAQFLGTLRRWDEGLAEANKAVALDPLSPGTHLTRGLLLMGPGRSAEAKAALRHALELEPDMHEAVYILASYCALEGDYEGAAAMFERFARITDSDPAIFHTFLAALRDPSQRPAAVEALQSLDFYGAMFGSDLMTQLGAVDAALAALEQAARDRSPYLPWVNALPQYDMLRSDTRFRAILAWMDL
jgi:TolB-like protein/Tfp pilus assembly protein PilF